MYRHELKIIIMIFLFLGVCLKGGCVYYNTFYHAEKYYEDGLKEVKKSGGKVNQKARDNFQKSIKKCVKVLTTYPKSSYVDDALLLMGKAFYQKSEYEESIKAFDKLLTENPESDKRSVVLYWKAKAEFNKQLYPECLVTIDQIDDHSIPTRWEDELGFLRGETYFSMGSYLESYSEFNKLLEKESSSKWREEGLLRMAQCQFYLENYDEALRSFQELVESASTLSLKREGYFWIASSFSEIGRYQEAVDAYQELLTGDLSKEENIRARMGLGRQLILLDNLDDALEVFQLITFDYSKTPEAAEANYLRGKLYLEDFRDSDKAREEFKKGYRNAPGSEYGKMCKERWIEVERLKKLMEYIDDEVADRSGDLPQAYYLIAEFYLYQIKDTEEALEGFQVVIDSFPGSPWVPKALYAKAWVLETGIGDSVASEREFRQIIDGFPDTRYADYARLKLDMDLPERPLGFYEDEFEGELLSAVTVDADIPMSDEVLPVESVSDTISEVSPDSVPTEEPAEGDTLSGG
jgi:tetratricopeptide (TPR) repeat protein